MKSRPAPISRSRRFLFLGLLILAPVAGFLLLAEVYVRLLLKNQVDTDRLRARINAGSIAAFVRRSEDPVLGYELIPNKVARLRNSTVCVSADGYRGPYPELVRAPATIRIAVIGDSTAFGWGVDYEETYPERFRARMEALVGQPVELRNYAVPGYNSEQECRQFTQRILSSYSPNLLVLGYDHNDPEPALTSKAFLGGLLPEDGDNPFHSHLLKYVIRKVHLRAQRKRQLRFDGGSYEFVDNPMQATGWGPIMAGDPLYDQHLEALRQIAVEARKRSIPVVAVVHNPFVCFDPHYETNANYVRLTGRLATNLTSMGYFLLNLYQPYQERMRQEGTKDLMGFWLTPAADPHPNAAGHEFIAGQLSQYVAGRPELMRVLSR